MKKKSGAQLFLKGQINIARCFPRIACEVRDLLADHVKHVDPKCVMLESTAITTFLVNAGVVEFANHEESRDSERVWAFMMCYVAVRQKYPHFRMNTSNIEETFECVAMNTYRMYIRATTHERTTPSSR